MRLNIFNYLVFIIFLSLLTSSVYLTVSEADLRDIGDTDLDNLWSSAGTRNNLLTQGVNWAQDKAYNAEIIQDFQKEEITTEDFDAFDKFVAVSSLLLKLVGTVISLLLYGWMYTLIGLTKNLGTLSWIGDMIIFILYMPLIYALFKVVFGGRIKN